jgi:hypothetical protein
MRCSSGTSAWRSATARWTAIAQATASTTLPNSQKRAVAHELDDAAFVLRDQGLDKSLSEFLEALERGRFVALDQARIADHVGRENGGETAVDAGGSHGVTSSYSNVLISKRAAASDARMVISDVRTDQCINHTGKVGLRPRDQQHPRSG